tara:strand:+ start:2913 stop:3050 length:138 start_codon:yes stop_codon:yes gene_type:complete
MLNNEEDKEDLEIGLPYTNRQHEDSHTFVAIGFVGIILTIIMAQL